ncbi:Slp family lipoprotein [Ignatzschineria sp. LJL83]
MMKKLLKIGSSLFVMLLIVGCSTFNGQNISNMNPDAYGEAQVLTMNQRELVGKEVLLGGMITTITPQGDQVRVEVVPYPLNQVGSPITSAGAIDGMRVVVDIYGSVRTKGYTPGDYFTAVGNVKSVENITVAKEKIRVVIMDASDYQFKKDPRREVYYDDYHFNSPAIRYYSPYWGFGFGPRYGYY